jgi:hypothetical protein
MTPNNNDSSSRLDTGEENNAAQLRINAYFASQERIAEADIGEEQDPTMERSAIIPRNPAVMRSTTSSKGLRGS